MKKLMIVALMLTLGMGLAMAQDKKSDCPKAEATTACVSKTPCDDCKTQGKHECDSKKKCDDKQQCKGEAKQHCSKDAATKQQLRVGKQVSKGEAKQCAGKKECKGEAKQCDGKKECKGEAKHECKGEAKHECSKEAAKKDCCKDK